MLSKTLTNNRTRNGFIATNRPDSAQLVDLHVYIIPKSVWKNVQHLAQNAAMDDAISVGFVRVPPDMKLQNLREQIERLCRIENDFPRDFIFLRSVGRCLTRVKQTQENELKVKHYRPPLTYASEIYLLEGRHEDYTYTPADSPAMSSANYLFGNRHQYRLNLDDRGQSSSRFSNYDPRKPLHDETKNLSKPNVYDLTSYLPSSGRRDWTKFTRNDSEESSPRELLKLQEEQERLRRRQAELQRIRRAVEEKKLNSGREKEEEEKRRRQEKTETERRRLEQQTQAATKIQASFRGFKDRQAYRKGQQNVLKNYSRISSSKTNIFNKESIKNKENIDINDDELSDSQILSLSSSIESTSDVDSNSSRTETRTIKKQDTESTHSNSSSSLSQKTERKIQSNILSDSKTDESNNINDENIRSTTVTKIRHSADEILPLATPDSDDDIHELEKQETETKRRRQLEEDKRKAKELEEQRQRKLTQKHEDPEHLRTRLQELQTSRVDLEKIQSEVIKNLKYMHSRITLRRREARDMWKKKYFQEKKKTSSLEEQSTQLKTELDQINKKILDIMGKESKHSAQIGHLKSAEVGDFILQITRIQQEILDIRHQIDLAKLRLTTDIKLRNQAENESRTLKYELTQAKMNLKHIRNRIGV
ncbi:unnamed protein product [Rotaria sordida]|uniref:Spermatogenesis-associated protein 1 C-terminal domain-containing protein n=1 Tax=Rotaria sordida TaxID=392033 RepID=A0A813N846_9BILA|nr:unnamed protein product [Rotaria sordida]CAF0801179.1 unnamed protein product [Rotaria sordida]CAF3553548.1 unnamed protein product [Rotaria sordida]